MLLKILLLSIVTGIVGINTPFNVDKTIKFDELVTTDSIKQRNYQHTDWISGNTEVVYKFESNEVNSFDDLVVGNIYKIDLTGYSSTQYRNILYTSLAVFTFNQQVQIISTNEVSQMVYTHNPDNSNVFVMYSGSQYRNFNIDELIFKYDRSDVGYLNEFIQYVSYTDFNVIESVTYHQPTTIIGYINEFFEQNLLGEIPFIRDINFEIGGQNINLLTWVIMAIGLVIVGLLIFAFIKLIIWLVKIFSNSFFLR